MTLEFPTVSMVDVEVIAAGMLALLGAVWALKKALAFLSGSDDGMYYDPNRERGDSYPAEYYDDDFEYPDMGGGGSYDRNEEMHWYELEHLQGHNHYTDDDL